MDCKYCQDEICVNADCPMCAEYCPVVDVPGVCRFEERSADMEAEAEPPSARHHLAGRSVWWHTAAGMDDGS